MDSSISDLLLSGVKLMLIGMGIVYLFLALLVGVIRATAAWILRAQEGPAEPSEMPLPAEGAGDPEETEVVAVIATALQTFRKQ